MNQEEKVISRIYNSMGQDVELSAKGLIFILYDDGTVKKQWN